MATPTVHSDTDFFKSTPAPAFLDSYRKLTCEFVQQQQYTSRNVVLITSGGTTVPLENQTVRFVDNFSAGTRGATSAEYFLDAGYAVIFLHRQFSLLPYSRHYSHTTNCFLDFMAEDGQGRVVVGPDYQSRMRDVLRRYNAVRKENRLLLLSFTTVAEYLWSLKEIATNLRPLGPRALFYLAAAVSDFFLPKNRLSEHKIQSGEAGGSKLTMDLDPVPKFLKNLVDGWAPEGMIVSFKLETDPSLLLSKAQKALAKYSHHLVIGNMLFSRKYEVVFVAPNVEPKWIRVPLHRRIPSRSNPVAVLKQLRERKAAGQVTEEEIVSEGDEGTEIESLIVPEVARMHQTFISITQEYHEADEQDMVARAVAWAEFGSD